MSRSWAALARLLHAVPIRRLHTTAVLAATAMLAVTGLALIAAAPPAAAAGAAVTVSPQAGLNPDYATTLTVSGTGFQDIPGGFGGIYILFGWVDTHWQPSAGGVSGKDYVYVEDEETKDNHGYIKFVSYSDGATLSAANGGIVTPQGTWSTTMIVPGATFPASGENGQISQVNCLQVQCGVITIGAHGVVDPDNETFTPVTFAATSAPVTATPNTVAPPTTSAPTTVPPTTLPPTTLPSTTVPPTTAAPTTTTTSTTVAAGIKVGGDPPPKRLAATPASSSGGSGSSDAPWIAALAAVVVAGAASVWWRRHRKHRPPANPA